MDGGMSPLFGPVPPTRNGAHGATVGSAYEHTAPCELVAIRQICGLKVRESLVLCCEFAHCGLDAGPRDFVPRNKPRDKEPRRQPMHCNGQPRTTFHDDIKIR